MTTCDTCQHFTPHASQKTVGECHWAESVTLPENRPFWTLHNLDSVAFVQATQEGCKAHAQPLAYPEIHA